LVLRDDAVDTINFGGDVTIAETMTKDCQILATALVAMVRCHVEDDRHSLGLVTRRVVDITVVGIVIKDVSSASLPLHGHGMVLSDRKLANLTSNSVLSPATKTSGARDSILEVHESTRDTGIDKRHLIRLKVRDELHRTLGVEPNFSHGIMVDDRRRQIMEGGRVVSCVSEKATPRIQASQLGWLKVVVGDDLKRETHRLKRVKVLLRHAE